MTVPAFSMDHVAWVLDDTTLDWLCEELRAAPEIVFDLETTGLHEHATTGGEVNGGVAARISLASFTLPRDDEMPTTWVLPLSHPDSPHSGSWRRTMRKVAYAIRESRVENGEPSDRIGCVRDFRLQNGDRIREKLLGLSDYDYFCTYSILESPMPLTDYIATLRLTPITDGDRTFAEWSAEFDCAPDVADDLVGNIGLGVFQAGFDSLKRHFGG